MTSPDPQYIDPRLAALYDQDSPWSIDRDFYLQSAGPSPIKVLDLGCGTGLICDAYAARGHEVTGVDPAPAMLDIARQKPYGDQINWVLSSAEHYRSKDRFDLIIMTGHAFQVLLNDTDILATFATMRDHLKPDGRIIFESRNPKLDWPKIWATQNKPHMLADNIRQTWQFIAQEPEFITFEHQYAFPDETLISRSKLRFLSKQAIEQHLSASGLIAEKVLGDWDKSNFDENHSPEIIFIAKHKPA